VHDWVGLRAWEGRHEELLREAEEGRLARGLRASRRGRIGVKSDVKSAGASEGIEVRWGLLEDEAKIADLLQLNGMPRWVAFEERYVVGERNGEILAALRYRTEPKRLLLGLLVVDPWAEERPLAVALYAGAGRLAREMGVSEVLIGGSLPHADYPREAGYRRMGRREWRLDASRSTEARGEPVAGKWRRLFGLFGIPAVPFVGLLRK
jgi:hypothetical protein